MRKLIYTISVSLDGYINDAKGSLDWVRVDEEYHRFANDQMAQTGTSIYGANMWRTMVFWDTDGEPGWPAFMLDFARLWRPAEKLVFSKHLQPSDMVAGARLMRGDVVAEVTALKAQAGKPIAVSGATIASTLIDAGLVDEIQPVIVPAILGGGTPFLSARSRRDYDLAGTHAFKNGMTFLRYVRR
jgi:dihydrofolate reductase